MDIANYSSDSRAVIKIAREVASEFRYPKPIGKESEHCCLNGGSISERAV